MGTKTLSDTYFQNAFQFQEIKISKGLPKLVGFAPGAEHWPNRKAYKAEILHGGLEYPNDKVLLVTFCLKLHLKKVNFLQFLQPKFGIFWILAKLPDFKKTSANFKAKDSMET